MAEKITDALTRKATSQGKAQLIIWDDAIKGFGIRITKSGAKSFILNYRTGQKSRRITIGSYPDWKVAAAREKAKELKRAVDLGEDPMGERAELRAAPTVKVLWEKYRDEHLIQKTEMSRRDEVSMWEKIILPKFGKERLEVLTHDRVQKFHTEITQKRGTPTRANRVIASFRKAYNLAIRWGWVIQNPAASISLNAEVKRQRYLTQDELIRVFDILNDHHEKVSANAIKLLILTGARRGEVLKATWDMFDLEQGVWTKPSSHTKQKREHRVPLSSEANELLKEIRKTTNSEFVFPSRIAGQPIQDVKKTWASICAKLGLKDVRIHDLRHSFASLLVSGGSSLPLIGAMLGHTQVSTTARYAHLYDAPLRAAAEQVSVAIKQLGKS